MARIAIGGVQHETNTFSNVLATYADFVAPGQTLTVSAEIISHTDRETKLKVQGVVDGKLNVSARLVVGRYNLGDTNPACASADAHVIRQMRLQFGVLCRPSPRGSPSSANGNAASPQPLACNPAAT
jgi:hypothetical protein